MMNIKEQFSLIIATEKLGARLSASVGWLFTFTLFFVFSWDMRYFLLLLIGDVIIGAIVWIYYLRK